MNPFPSSSHLSIPQDMLSGLTVLCALSVAFFRLVRSREHPELTEAASVSVTFCTAPSRRRATLRLQSQRQIPFVSPSQFLFKVRSNHLPESRKNQAVAADLQLCHMARLRWPVSSCVVEANHMPGNSVAIDCDRFTLTFHIPWAPITTLLRTRYALSLCR